MLNYDLRWMNAQFSSFIGEPKGEYNYFSFEEDYDELNFTEVKDLGNYCIVIFYCKVDAAQERYYIESAYTEVFSVVEKTTEPEKPTEPEDPADPE